MFNQLKYFFSYISLYMFDKTLQQNKFISLQLLNDVSIYRVIDFNMPKRVKVVDITLNLFSLSIM